MERGGHTMVMEVLFYPISLGMTAGLYWLQMRRLDRLSLVIIFWVWLALCAIRLAFKIGYRFGSRGGGGKRGGN